MKQGENNIPRIENQKHWQVVDAVFHHIEFSFITDPINFAKIWNLKLDQNEFFQTFLWAIFDLPCDRNTCFQQVQNYCWLI